MGLILIDQTTLWVGFYGEASGLRGAIITEAEDAVSWGKDQVEAYRDQLSPAAHHRLGNNRTKESPLD